MARNVNILNYWPTVIGELREFQAIATSENPELTSFWGNLEIAMNAQFISDANETGIARWEKAFKINPLDTDSLDVRRSRVLRKFQEKLPYTYRSLEQILTVCCGEGGFSITLDPGAYTFTIESNLVIKEKFDEVYALLKKILPANLILEFVLMFNQHVNFEGFTHDHLRVYTHDQLRNGVIV